MNNKRYTIADVKFIETQINTMSLVDIAKELGRDTKAVYAKARSLGLASPQKAHKDLVRANAPKILECLSNGEKPRSVAKKFGTTYETVIRLRRDNADNTRKVDPMMSLINEVFR